LVAKGYSQQKQIGKDNFKMKKKEKKTCGEVKAEFSTSSIFLKKIDKDNFEKKTCGETL
jgi:hypothetical protein